MARRTKQVRSSNLPDSKPEEDVVSHEQPEIPAVTAKLILDRHHAAEQAIRKERREYWMNRAFLSGHQWIKWNERDHSYAPWRRQGGRTQVTVNKLDSLTNTVVAKLMQQDLVFEVPASSADDYALEGALIAESILRQKRVSSDWEPKREELYVATITGGTAALVVDWDKSLNTYGAGISTGDTTETVLPITEFCVEPGAKSAKRARWWIKEQILPPEQVQALFKLEEAPPANYTTGGAYSGGLMNSGGAQTGCRVLTYYERPNFLRPGGCVAVVVGSQLVWGPKPWPFPFKDHLNIEVARAIVVPGQWTGETPLSKARQVQVQLNFVYSNIQEHIKKIGTAKLAAPYGSSEVFDQMDDDPGNPLRYPDGAQPPHYIQAPNMPGYIIQQLNILENDMQDIMGIHAISMGESPANVESGYGISLLAEQDASPAARLAKDCARSWAGTASSVLELLAAKVKETRTATVFEPKRDIAHVVKWTGKDLAGQTNAVIPPDSVLPRSRAQMQMWAENMAKMGFIEPGPAGLTMIMEIAEIPGRDEALWYINPQEARARRDVYRMMEGEVVVPQDFHDHKVAIQVVNRFRNSPRYEALPKNVKRVFDLYAQAHETMDAEEAGKQVQQASVSPALAQSATAAEMSPLPPEMLGLTPQPSSGTLPQGTPEAPPEGMMADPTQEMM